MTTETENAEKQIEDIFDNEFFTLMDGDCDLRLYKTTVPIDEDRELYQQGWRSYVYVRREYDVGEVANDSTEYQHWKELSKVHDTASERLREINDLHNDITAVRKVVESKLGHVDEHAKSYMKELLENASAVEREVDAAATSLAQAEEYCSECYEPEFGVYTVGIVSPTLAGVKACEELLKHISWLGGRPPRNSQEWQMAACQELIFHGTCAPLLDFMSVTGVAPDQRCLDFVKELCCMTAGFQLDKQINAVGATGWDWLSGDTLGRRRR